MVLQSVMINKMNEAQAIIVRELEKAEKMCEYHNAEILALAYFGEIPKEMSLENMELHDHLVNLQLRLSTLNRLAHIYLAVADTTRKFSSESNNPEDVIKEIL